MSVMRLGYIHARVTDLDEARRHYVDTLGMQIVQEEDPAARYRRRRPR
jgi:catechol 2,3-dioxygenase